MGLLVYYTKYGSNDRLQDMSILTFNLFKKETPTQVFSIEISKNF